MTVTVEAFREHEFAGRVSRIDPQALTDQTITTVLVEVEMMDKDIRLIPGLTTTCDFMVKEEADALRLAPRAVKRTGEKPTVRVPMAPGSEGPPKEVPVELGLEGDEYVVILSGLSEGDEVLMSQFGAQEEENRGREFGRRMGGGGFR